MKALTFLRRTMMCRQNNWLPSTSGSGSLDPRSSLGWLASAGSIQYHCMNENGVGASA